MASQPIKDAGPGTNLPWMLPTRTFLDKSSPLLPKAIPMRLLCLGLGRTGTASLRMALRELGFQNIYHASAVMENPPDGPMWEEAIHAKYGGKGKLYGKKEFDSLLWDFDAVTDTPANCFVEELIEAYPEARVLVTTRDVDSWYSSWMKTIYPVNKSSFLPFMKRLDSTFRQFSPCLSLSMEKYYSGDFIQNGKRVFAEHYAKVRLLAPKDKYFEYNVKDGWEPLCKFLELEVPRDEHGQVKPFPRVNDGEHFAENWAPLFHSILTNGLLRWAKSGAAVMAVGIGIWWAWRR